MKNLHILLVLILALGYTFLISGCVNSSLDQTQPSPTEGETAPEQPTTEEPAVAETPDRNERRPEPTLPGGLERVPPIKSAPVVGEVPEDLLEEILTDLAEKTGVEREVIEVVRAEVVVWNDGSLGCPKPGEFYIQVLINGYWVVLEVEGIDYDYRANDTGYFFLCEGKGMPPFSPPSDEIGKPPPDK